MNQFLERLQFSKQKMLEFQKKIRKLDEFKGFWKGHLNISPQILHRLKNFALITSTGASTRIEGSYLSDEEVKKLLKGLKIQKLSDRSQQEVAGYADLTKLIFDEHKSIKWNENSVKHFHKILLHYSTKDAHHLGKYKKSSNAVVARDSQGGESIIYHPTAPYLTAKEMKELVVFTKQNLKNKEIHPIIVIGHFIGEFLAIHPFQDGNGRLSRALTNLLLLQEGHSYVQYVSLEKIIEDRKEEYYLALRKSQKNRAEKKHDLTAWMDFFLDTLIRQTKQAKDVLQRKNIKDELSENQLIILNLIQKSENAISVKELLALSKINRNTIRKVLERLRDLLIIKQVGLGRASRWKLIGKE
jgi:Fic family protein